MNVPRKWLNKCSVYAYLINNPCLLKEWQKCIKFYCDFETLSAKNAKINKYGFKTSKVYLWAIKSQNDEMVPLWGTEVEDFWACLELLTQQKNTYFKKSDKVFYFVNLAFDYTFIENIINEKYVLHEDFTTWFDFVKQYKDGRIRKQKYALINSTTNNIIAVHLTGLGQHFSIKCLWRKTNCGVEAMQSILEANNIETPKKLKKQMDYDLVDKVYCRCVLYKKVFGFYDEKNFLYNSLNRKSKYGYLIKYAVNDVIIPQIFHKWFNKKLQYLNVKLSGGLFLYGMNKAHFLDKNGKHIYYKIIIHKINPLHKYIPTFTHGYEKMEEYKSIIGKEIIVKKSMLKHLKNHSIIEKLKLSSKKTGRYMDPKKYTTSSISMNGLKLFLGTKNFTKMLDNVFNVENYYVINKAFKGGFTSFNPKIRYDKHKVISLDINSSYPFQMFSPMPYGKILKEKPKGDYVAIINVEIIAFVIKNPRTTPPFFASVRISNKFLNRYLDEYRGWIDDDEYFGSFNTSFYLDEWEFFNKYYHVRINEKKTKIMYFKAKPYLKKYINIMKEIKDTSKTKGDRDMAKLMLNAIFGKMSQGVLVQSNKTMDLNPKYKTENINWLNKWVKTYSHFNAVENKEVYGITEDFHDNMIKLINNPKNVEIMAYEYLRFINEKRTKVRFQYYKPITDDTKLMYRHVGGLITWYGRKQLLNTILHFGYQNVRYWDTDSIYIKYNKETKQKLQKLEIHDTKFGAWKLEKQISEMLVLGAKQYRLKVEKTYSGNGKWQDENGKYIYVMGGLKDANEVFEKVGHDKFKPGYIVEGKSLKRKILTNGIILVERDFLIKEGTI